MTHHHFHCINFQLDIGSTLKEQCLAAGEDALVQINVTVEWETKRINILDVVKPSGEAVKKYENRRRQSDNTNDDSMSTSSSDLKSPTKLTSGDDFESSNSSKRNQKPSEFTFKLIYHLSTFFLNISILF